MWCEALCLLKTKGQNNNTDTARDLSLSLHLEYCLQLHRARVTEREIAAVGQG